MSAKSNITSNLRLLFISSKVEKWLGKHMIIAVECENVAITGTGIIDGCSSAFFGEYNPPSAESTQYTWMQGSAGTLDLEKLRPGQMICFIESKNIIIKDVTMQNAPCWTCFLHGCDYAQITGVKIINPDYHLNTDGIDIDTCRYVTISDCIIKTGDDAITFRGCGNRLKDQKRCCEYISVTNCVLSASASAFRIGVGTFPIRHIQVSNITVEFAGVCINFYPEWANTSHTPIEDVHFSNISVDSTGRMIELNINNNTPVKNIRMSNITGKAMAAIKLFSTSEEAVSNIQLENIDITAMEDSRQGRQEKAESRCKAFVWFYGIQKLKVNNCQFFVDKALVSQWEQTVCVENCPDIDGKKIAALSEAEEKETKNEETIT